MLSTDVASGPYVAIGDSRDREVWLRIRHTGVGASEASIVVGESRRKSVPMLFAQKRAGLEPELGEETEDGDAPEWLEWGLRHEPTILAAYSSERYAHRPAWSAGQLLRSTAHPWALATLDAWCTHPVHGVIPLELKTAEVWRGDDWLDGPPRDYFWQLQQQMLVTGAPCASIACLLGVHRMVWCDIERDEIAIARLTRAGARFWESVERDEVPPGPLDARSLHAVYPRDNGSEIELDGSFITLDEERCAIEERMRADHARMSAINAELRGAIGHHAWGVLPNYVAYSLRTDRRGRRALHRRAPKHERTH